jgi:hypothetical protein
LTCTPAARLRSAPGSPACAFTTFATPMQALVLAGGSACRSSASCWGIPRRRRHTDTRTSMPILFAEHRRRSVAGSRRRWTESERDQWCSLKAVVAVERLRQQASRQLLERSRRAALANPSELKARFEWVCFLSLSRRRPTTLPVTDDKAHYPNPLCLAYLEARRPIPAEPIPNHWSPWREASL